MKKFLIIDANSLIHRAFHALPPLTTKDGTQVVNAVYGFTTILLKALKDFKPDYIACCFDVDKNTFRKKMYPEYKAQRKEQPNELYTQFPLIKELLEAFHIPIYEKQGFEADDLLGTLSLLTKTNFKDIKNVIVSSDLDILQLVDKKTEVYTMKKGVSETVTYDEQAVFDRFEFTPPQLIDFKGLRGDSSDNIPGVRGVGEKTAITLIKNFKTLEGLYEFLDPYDTFDKKDEELKKNSIKPALFEKLKEQKEMAFLSKELATIKRDVEIDFKLEDTRIEPFDTELVVSLFKAWNFNSLIARIPNAEKIIREKQGSLFDAKLSGPEKEEKFELKKGYELINSKKSFVSFLDKLKKQEQFAIDTETTGLDTLTCDMLGVSISWDTGTGFYITSDVLKNDKNFKKILEDESIKKIGHNLKFDFKVLKNFGIEMKGLFFDTMIASYLLNPGSRQHSLDNLAFIELGYRMQSIEELTGETKKDKIDLTKVDLEKVAGYAIEDADITWRLHLALSEKMEDDILENVLEKIEMPLISVLAEMETTGILLDVNFLEKMRTKISKDITKLEAEIYKIAGREFNVASPLQIKEILFDELNISTAGLKRTKTGISTAAGELEKLRGRHKIIDMISDFRELSKLNNTYLKPLPKLIDKDSRIHTSFNQTITATGRLSSSDPNLQNIPIRTDLGRQIRNAFVANKDSELVAVDYSQVELRIAASLSGDQEMTKAFRQGHDIHTETAAKIFEVEQDKVTSQMRRQAKEVNFGILYGLGPKGLAQRTGISHEEAIDFIEKYFEIFDGLRNWIEETIEITRELGWSETIFGRKRMLPEINTRHPQLRSQAERMAINHPVQGTAADLIKIAMINLQKRIKKEFVDGEVKMLLQVHDELVFEIKKDVVKHARKIISEEMETAYKLNVPLLVESGAGKSWGEAK
jgi:DNA polymerase I